ncbi:RNA polymerase sigma factor [Zunongwangia sp. HRR-M8]|uniref:RNA polymerase sigma factor n=1 Tax=Zunongwangia sp. HRR-M8 TaxID=3015170 RepID=UPI0022DE3307|nr:RNA polymerase sigma-70 factor [Zunongwangia sp. HRR-M8]WBL21487.1 RNA polymerase sigma-70 factor [Zunongwangia sp. HRR-M8]
MIESSMDDEFLKKIKKGDKRALTCLYNKYWKMLYMSSFNILKDREICEEIIQDVFIDVWNNRAKLQIKVSLKSYLFACVKYKVFSEFRKNKAVHLELFENLDTRLQQVTPESKIIDQELRQHIDIVVNNLPKKCQKVYKLSRYEQLSHKEIAEKLGISTKTVENHIGIALKVLRTSLGSIYIISLFISL